MKLAVLTAQISPYHNARFVGAAKEFDEVHVVSSVNDGDFPEFLATSLGDYKIHFICDGRKDYKEAFERLALHQQITDALAAVHPHAIAVAGWSAPESLVALEYGRKNGIPTVVMSESQADDAPRSWPREVLKKRIVSQFDAALVGGPSHADYIVGLGMPRDRVHLGYNAVDNNYFEREAERAKASQDQLRAQHKLPQSYLLASARFIRKKNLPNLVRAFAGARRINPSIPDLMILGDGPERANIEEVIRSNEVTGVVHLPGFRGYDALPAIYALSEGFLHVSTTEQWGLVINEAMAAGVPVIASNTCGAARTVLADGVNGLSTDIDAASIEAAILRLFDMTPEQRAGMGMAAQAAIRYWGPDRFGVGLMDAVKAAMRAPRRGPIRLLDKALIHRLQRTVLDAVA